MLMREFLQSIWVTRTRMVLFVLCVLFMLLAAAPHQSTLANTTTQIQQPTAPPDDDPAPGEVGDVLPVLPQPQREVSLAILGGAWAAQGPGPAYNGQVENITNKEVVGAVHVLAAHPTDADILYAGGTNGGIWKTTNATSTNPNWVPQTDDKASLSMGALEFDPTDGTNNTLVAGIGRYSSFASNGGPRTGLLRTTDGGTNWNELNNLAGKNISGVAPRGNTIVASSNVADLFTCGNIGLFRSTNTGATFTQVGLDGVAFDLASDPTNTAILYSGMTYVNFCNGGGSTNGIYKSTDTGANWNKVSDAAMDALIVDGTTNNIEIDVHGSNVFVNIVQNGQTVGIFYSGNGGTSWTAMDLPLLPVGTPAAINNVLPGSPIIIDTGVAHGLSNGDEVQISGVVGTTGANGIHTIIYISTTSFALPVADFTPYISGGTWEKLVGMNPRFKPGGQGGIHASIRIDPTTNTTVYLGGDRQDLPFPNYIGASDYSGNLSRGDATVGATGTSPSPQWDHLTHSDSVAAIPGGGTANSSSPHADSREMIIDANGEIIEGDDGGIYRRTSPTNNTGDWFSIIGDMQVTEMHDVAYDSLSNKIISGNQDTGTTYQTAAGGTTWNSISTADGGDVAVDNIVLAGSNQSVRYSSFQNLGAFRRSVWDNAGNFVSQTFPALTVTGGGAAFVAKFVTPVVTNHAAGDWLLIGGANSLYESTDGGSTITEIGPGLKVNSAGHTLDYGTIGNVDAFYAASGGDDVSVRTASAGPINTYLVASTGDVIRGVAMDPANYMNGFAIDSDQVFRTINAGVSWTDITGTLTDNNLRSIVAAPGALYVGGGVGVYKMDTSTPGTWVQFGTGLPHAPVWDLDYDDADKVLVAGTLGRGAWLISTEDCLPPTAVTDLASSKNGLFVDLTWTDTGADAYDIHRTFNDFYFAPAGGNQLGTALASPYTDMGAGIIGDVTKNYGYVVVAKNNCGGGTLAAPSNRVGEFDFGIEPGTP